MLFSEEEVKKIVETAQNVVVQRFDILSKTASFGGAVLNYLQKDKNCCVQACEFVNRLSLGPMTADKVFLADLAIAVTRVWEAFTKNSEGGGNNFFGFPFILADQVDRNILFRGLG